MPTSSRARDAELLSQIEPILRNAGVEEDAELAADMMASIVKLAKDKPGRAEMKLMARAFKELRYAFKVFKPYRQQRKVSIFGSARTPLSDPNYPLAVKFGELSVKAGFMVITGAGGGIMAAGHEGAGQANSFGVAIKLPFEQHTNDIIANNEKLIHFRYFFSRKLVFVKETHAIALFPGGFGTHDEGFEVLTLVQTGRCDPMPIVLCEAPGGDYWGGWDRFIRAQLLGNKLISEEDLSLYHITTDPAEGVAHMARFYRNYHSLRYADDKLMLRMKQGPTEAELATLQEKFKDIVSEGTITMHPASEVEPETQILPDAQRLMLTFNRRCLGRLRQLIDALNELKSLPADTPAGPAGSAQESDRGLSAIAEEEPMTMVAPVNNPLKT